MLVVAAVVVVLLVEVVHYLHLSQFPKWFIIAFKIVLKTTFTFYWFKRKKSLL